MAGMTTYDIIAKSASIVINPRLHGCDSDGHLIEVWRGIPGRTSKKVDEILVAFRLGVSEQVSHDEALGWLVELFKADTSILERLDRQRIKRAVVVLDIDWNAESFSFPLGDSTVITQHPPKEDSKRVAKKRRGRSTASTQ